MDRRRFLLTVGTTAVVAGCVGSEGNSTPQDTVTSEPTAESTPESTPEPTPEPTSESTPEPTPESTPEETQEPTAEPTPEETPEPTPEPTSEPNLTIQEQNLSTADTPFHDAYAEAVVENTGSGRCGSIELTARWFDNSGNFVEEETTFLPTLGAGETWIARVGTSRERGEIDDFELSGEYDVSPGRSATGLSVANDSLNIEDEYSGTITAEVENTRDESLFMATFHGLIYDNDGRVIGGRETRESDISPGEDLFFEVSLSSTRTVHRISKAADHTVLVTESETTDTRQF